MTAGTGIKMRGQRDQKPKTIIRPLNRVKNEKKENI